MTVPAPLKDWTDVMRSTVNRVTGIFANDELANVKNGLENIAGMIVMSDTIRTAMQQMLEDLGPLRRLLNSPGILVGGSALEEVKAKACAGIDRLEIALETARPNETTKAIGLGW